MLSVFIPVYNEAEILERTVDTVHQFLVRHGIDHELIVASNGSTDRTCEIGRQLAADNSWLRFFELPQRGAGAAFRLAVEQARNDYLVTLDADLAGDLNFLLHAGELLKHAEMVVGSKTMGRQRRNFFRVLASQIYIVSSQLWFDLTISDYSLGSKGYRRSAILPALPHLDNWTGYVFELAVYLRQQDKRLIQIGVNCDDRRKSRFNLFYEGFHRFRHLARCHRELKRPDSWFRKP